MGVMMDNNAVEGLAVDTLIGEMAAQLRQQFGDTLNDAKIIGIHTGGTWVAQQLHQRLDNPNPLGELNISFYRDDFTQIGLHPQVSPSNLPFEMEGAAIILVDDVLYSGRTIRAALNEIFDYGRPARVTLAVLVDRDERELPIRADVTGTRVQLQAGQQIKLIGPEPLTLQLQEQ
jgi:pyrimidine operon attenuation protein/uracil phosphoribosyltransferase